MQEILPKTGMNLEDIMPNEIGKTEKDKCYMISLMCALLKKKVELRESRMVIIRINKFKSS